MYLEFTVDFFKLVSVTQCLDLFIRFSAQNKSENSNKTGTRALGNQVIRKGHMCIQNLGIMKGKNFPSAQIIFLFLLFWFDWLHSILSF